MTDMNKLLAALLLQLIAFATFAAPTCAGTSGAQTTALVELYTSEGCSSCPPADKWLSALPGPNLSLRQAVPIALHVHYWDYIGWKDPFAQPLFAERQRWLVSANNRRTSYTPHFFVSGAEVYDQGGKLDATIRLINSQPARADIEIRSDASRPDVLAIHANASARVTNRPLQLFLAVTESQLVTAVKAGENRGATLHHANVARKWIGPLPLVGNKIDTVQEVTLDAGWVRKNLKVTGFVQDSRNGEVLQALALENCAS
jgi:hypothetical protein